MQNVTTHRQARNRDSLQSTWQAGIFHQHPTALLGSGLTVRGQSDQGAPNPKPGALRTNATPTAEEHAI